MNWEELREEQIMCIINVMRGDSDNMGAGYAHLGYILENDILKSKQIKRDYH